MANHRYWRLRIGGVTSGNQVDVVALELRTSSGGANLSITGNGTASASSDNGSTVSAAKAFDNDGATLWGSGLAPAFPQWLAWDFGAGNEQDINHVKLTNSGYGVDYHATGCTIEYSDDNAIWTNKLTFTNSTSAGAVTYYPPDLLEWDFAPAAMALDSFFGTACGFQMPVMALDMLMGADVEFSAPTVMLEANFGGTAGLAVPAMVLDAAMHDTTGENAIDFTAPMVTLGVDFGAQGAFGSPVLSLDAGLTVSLMVSVDLMLPMMALDAGGFGSCMVEFNFAIPMASIEEAFGAGCDFDLTMMTLSADMTAGGMLGVNLNLPVMSLDAQATLQNHGSLGFSLPMMVPGVSMTQDFAVPMLALDGVITATIAVSYEAYCLNLKHIPQPNQIVHDELTHYTNYPFQRIVRWKNHYFGVAVDGLYLLEGTTDYDPMAPSEVAWAWQTAVTDFDESRNKMVIAGYYAGRFPAAATLSVLAGEGTPNAYAYATPRGGAARNHRQVFGKGICALNATRGARYYAFAGAGQGEMELSSIEFNVAALARRI